MAWLTSTPVGQPICEETPGLALKYREHGARRRQIGIFDLQREGQLAFQRVDDLQHFAAALATHK